ncbi:hypothetical protein F0562_000025 [Nyssa sinensis]|uniref:PROP1-like PPR domain-containing protein n=1 Tax=Nyssa sinensis TaxID=561372 RepID=A0A5J5C413_9ASTE|nr:hypothetical protein F0562_000025 [Nyssa sinensis]
MEMLLNLDISCKTTRPWRFNNNKNSLCKTLITKTSTTLIVSSSSINPSAPLHPKRKSQHRPPLHNANPHSKNSTKQTTLLVESFHEDDEDWTNDQFWAFIKFLIQTSRSKEILQVFDLWKNLEKLRINEFNYEKILRLLVEERQMEDAVSALRGMKSHGLSPSLEIYNSVIHGFASKGKFEDALFYLKEMEEINLKPDTETYDGLIEAYGTYKMYDEMGKCVKKMEYDGCSFDHVTYNLLIREFSRAGLLKRMERVYQTLLSKRMDLQASTLVAMLESYANFGILDKMEKVYRRALKSKTPLKEDLIRKLAKVYVENHMFSRLDDLGVDLSSKVGRTDLVWCLRMLSHAHLLSRKGMNSIVHEMELENVPWNVTVANIILLAYLKMKDLKHMKAAFSGTTSTIRET